MKTDKEKLPLTTPFAARVNTKKLRKAIKKNGLSELRVKVKKFIEGEGS